MQKKIAEENSKCKQISGKMLRSHNIGRWRAQDFNHEKVWLRIWYDQKWLRVNTSEDHSKRSRGNSSVDVSDTHVNIDLNAGSDVFRDEFEDVEAEAGPPAQLEELERVRQAKEDARQAQEEHIRQQQEILNALNNLEKKTTIYESDEDIEIIKEMKAKTRADLRRLI
ncbi:hypothetical protein LXL04_033372 [Taraxacum kok-saghyz]